jgi:hypothetical protein
VERRDEATELYVGGEYGDRPMGEFKVGLSTVKEMPWDANLTRSKILLFSGEYVHIYILPI